jgi:Flp pilus assembly protein TadG
MATQIVILNNDYIRVDDKFHIHWVDKGKNWNNSWLPNTIHAVIWNNLTGQNQIQNKDATTGAMTSNSNLSATSDAVGTTTIANLLTWAETRKGQIEQAQQDFYTDIANDEANSTTNSHGKNWPDYDSNYS